MKHKRDQRAHRSICVPGSLATSCSVLWIKWKWRDDAILIGTKIWIWSNTRVVPERHGTGRVVCHGCHGAGGKGAQKRQPQVAEGNESSSDASVTSNVILQRHRDFWRPSCYSTYGISLHQDIPQRFTLWYSIQSGQPSNNTEYREHSCAICHSILYRPRQQEEVYLSSSLLPLYSVSYCV
jgi:hypothetical protein